MVGDIVEIETRRLAPHVLQQVCCRATHGPPANRVELAVIRRRVCGRWWRLNGAFLPLKS